MTDPNIVIAIEALTQAVGELEVKLFGIYIAIVGIMALMGALFCFAIKIWR